VPEAVDDHRQLQPDQHEERRVEDEGQEFPEGPGLEAGFRSLYLRRPVAEIEAAGDRRQHPGDAELIGGQERRVTAEQRHRSSGQRVVDA
jgi:hypothetical protein